MRSVPRRVASSPIRYVSRRREDLQITTNIAVIVGSRRDDSFNKRLADDLGRIGPRAVSFKPVIIRDLPTFKRSVDADHTAPVKRLRSDIASAHALLFITPEHDRALPGVLKNALDHATRPPMECAWAGKPAGVLGVSVETVRSGVAQQHLRRILTALDVRTLIPPQEHTHAEEELFSVSGYIAPAKHTLLRHWIHSYVAWVESVRASSTRCALS